MEKVLPLVKDEAAKVWEYYAAGLIRSIYYIADMSGAVLLCEANSLEELTEAVNKFPMKQAKALNFEILPLQNNTLRPIVGQEMPFKDAARSHKALLSAIW